MHACLNWPEFNSRYDCLIGANLSQDFPENRHIMWRRLRIWCSYKASTLPLDNSTLEKTKVDNGKFTLTFRIPVGLGNYVRIKLCGSMLDNVNASLLTVSRVNAKNNEMLSDSEEITLSLRPDIEDRNFHMETKAYGLEKIWPQKIKASKNAFSFQPDKGRCLSIEADSKASFIQENEWSYNLEMKLEAERGLESKTDLFSPGYFKVKLTGGDSLKILGQITTPNDKKLTLNV